MKKKTTGIYWGRFNPPHKGHIALIKKLMKKVDSLIVAIGSAQEKNTARNPFSGKERLDMIKAYLKEEKISSKKVKVIIMKDKRCWKEASRNIFTHCPRFDVLFTNKQRIVKALGKRIKIKTFSRTHLSSTKLRKAIAAGKKWKHLTGKSVARLIKKFNGEARIKRAYK